MREMSVAEQRYKPVMAVINEGRTSPHQMAVAVEVELLEMRRAKPSWGARRLALELRRKGAQPALSKSAITAPWFEPGSSIHCRRSQI